MPARIMLGDWYPIHHDETRGVLGFLSNSLSGVAERFQDEQGRKPSFLDLGSGDGLVSVVAQNTGKYVHSSGIEVKATLNKAAQDYVHDFKAMDILKEGSVSLYSGSYYSDQYWPGIKNQWIKSNEPRIFSDKFLTRWSVGMSLGINDIPPQEVTPEIILHELNKSNHDALNDNHLLDSSGKLNADVIYWYPSDPFAEIGMVEQWNKIIKPGSYLVLGPSKQALNMIEQGVLDEDFERIGDRLEDKSLGLVPDFLIVYRKK